MSDVRSWAGSAPRASHDVAGAGLHLDLSDAVLSHVAWFWSCNVAVYCRPVEKQTVAGEFASRSAVGTHEAGHASRAKSIRALDSWYWGHDSSSKQEYLSHRHHCISCQLHCFCWDARETPDLITVCTEMYTAIATYIAAPPRDGPEAR